MPFAIRPYRRVPVCCPVTYCLFLLTITLPMPEVRGEVLPAASLREQKECTELMLERSAATRMEDWTHVDTTSRRFIETCSDAFGRRDVAHAYGSAADANIKMQRFEEALFLANAGIAAHYLEPTSHLVKVMALYAVNKLAEAKQYFKVADHVLHLAIDRNNADLQRSNFDHEREVLLAERELRLSELKLLNKYRPFLGE